MPDDAASEMIATSLLPSMNRSFSKMLRVSKDASDSDRETYETEPSGLDITRPLRPGLVWCVRMVGLFSKVCRESVIGRGRNGYVNVNRS